MAINIYSGTAPNKNKSSKVVNSASESTRQKRIDAQLQGSSAVSTSGNTAVKSKGTLSKVGNFIGKTAGIASKFLPGVAGTVAKGLANLFNDPEWWESVPGEGMTTNQPLRLTQLGMLQVDDGQGSGLVPLSEACLNRPPIAEVISITDDLNQVAVHLTPNMMTQYVMPQVRKLINAVPLEAANDYAYVLERNITIYALWHQLLKVRYLTQKGKTYIPNMNDKAFPILQVENSAFLDATINRLEEYLRSNVRLPHTICEYLAWRFGRIYQSNDSAKASMIMYNVISLHSATVDYSLMIERMMREISNAPSYQKAQSDLFNVYYAHDMHVIIPDSTQFSFDKKEFMLRINLDVDTLNVIQLQTTKDKSKGWMIVQKYPHHNLPVNPVIIDSSLDNQTVFMASTVSTHTKEEPLFPVRAIRAYAINGQINGETAYGFPKFAGAGFNASADLSNGFPFWINMGTSGWDGAEITSTAWICPYWGDGGTYDAPDQDLCISFSVFVSWYVGVMTILKALDFYNVEQYFSCYTHYGQEQQVLCDTTALSMDLGVVEDSVLENEQVYAFANLMHESRRTSTSSAAAEKQVTAETANLIDKLDIVSTP